MFASLNRESDAIPGQESVEARQARRQSVFIQALSGLAHSGHGPARKTALASLAALLEEDGGSSAEEKKLRVLCHRNLAAGLQDDGQDDDALRHFAAAADLDPENVNLWYRVARLAQRTGRLRLARTALETGLRIHPDHLPCSLALPQILQAIDDSSAVLAAEQAILCRDPCDAPAQKGDLAIDFCS